MDQPLSSKRSRSARVWFILLAATNPIRRAISRRSFASNWRRPWWGYTMIYPITEEEWQEILAIAEKRHRKEGKREDADLLGAVGEYAFSRVFGLPAPHTQPEEDAGWDFTMPNRTAVTVDVKTVSDDLHVVSLLVPKMGRAGVYVLCHLDYDTRIVTFVGWISGGEAKTYGRIASWGKHYKVPIDLLHDWSIFYNAQARSLGLAEG